MITTQKQKRKKNYSRNIFSLQNYISSSSGYDIRIENSQYIDWLTPFKSFNWCHLPRIFGRYFIPWYLIFQSTNFASSVQKPFFSNSSSRYRILCASYVPLKNSFIADHEYLTTTTGFFLGQKMHFVSCILIFLIIQKAKKTNPASKYWSPGRPEDVPLQRPQDVP